MKLVGATLLLAGLARPALAHSPHDVVRGAAVLDGEVVSAEEVRLARSTDDGETLLHSNSPAGTPTCLVPLATTAHAFVLVTDDGQAFRSLDSGGSWLAVEGLHAWTCAPALRGALVAGPAGLVRVLADGGEPIARAGSTLKAMAEAPWGEVVGVTAKGSWATVEGASWVEGAPLGYTAVAAGDGVLLRASGAGIEVNEGTGEWRLVNDLPALALGVAEAGWMAAGAEEGVLLSRDRGANWEWVTEGLEKTATGGGAPKPGAPHWFSLLGDGDTLWAGAWEGLYRMRSGESAWTQLQLRGQPMIRDLAWIGDELLLADNGAGLLRGTPGEDDWVDAAPGLDWPWLRALVPTEDGAGRWYFSGGVLLYRSDNGGALVRAVESGLAEDGDCIDVAPHYPNDPHAWAGGLLEDGTGAVAETVDAGETWSPVALEGCADKPAALAGTATGAWVGCGSGVWWGRDGAFSPVAVLSDGVGALLDDDGGVLAGTPAGLDRVALGGEVERIWAEARVDALAREPDGSVLAATSLGLVRFREGVAKRLGWPVDDVILTLSVSGTGAIAAGGYAGAFVSDDGGASFSSASDWDRYDDGDTAFTWSDAWVWESDDTAKTHRAHVASTPGAWGRWRVYGRTVRLVARGQGSLTVRVDGGAPETVTVETADWAAVTSWVIDEGWHRVEFTLDAGEVWVDGGDRWRTNVGRGPDATEAPGGECGCGHGPARPSGLVLAALLAGAEARRRRATGPRPAASPERAPMR